jgi:hypothetical protein
MRELSELDGIDDRAHCSAKRFALLSLLASKQWHVHDSTHNVSSDNLSQHTVSPESLAFGVDRRR